MNLDKIAKNVLAEAEKLQQGNREEQGLGNELAAVAERIEAYQKKNVRTINSENVEPVIEDLKASVPNRPRRESSAKRNWRS